MPWVWLRSAILFHFFGIKVVISFDEQMSQFHWHVVDSQSFPLSIPGFPELSQKGAYSSSEVYSSADVQDIVTYAGTVRWDLCRTFRQSLIILLFSAESTCLWLVWICLSAAQIIEKKYLSGNWYSRAHSHHIYITPGTRCLCASYTMGKLCQRASGWPTPSRFCCHNQLHD